MDAYEGQDSAEALTRLERWWADHHDLAGRPRLSLREWDRLSPAERSAVWQIQIDAVQSTADFAAVQMQILVLHRRRYEPAVPLLLDLFRRCAVTPIRDSAGEALLAIGSAAARAELRAGVDDHDYQVRSLALRALFTDPGSAWDNVAWLFASDRLDSDAGERVAVEALSFLAPNTFTREGPAWHLDSARRLIGEDRRWLDLCVRLRTQPSDVAWVAREALRHADPAITTPALDRAAAAVSAAQRPQLPKLEAGSLLRRYEAGEHREVWRELQAAEPLDEEWRAEAIHIADATMRRVRRNAARLAAALAICGWPLPASQMLVDPHSDTTAHLADLQAVFGVPVPPSMAAFWSIVGGIELVPWEKEMPASLPSRLIYLDPLEVLDLHYLWPAVDSWRDENQGVHIEIAKPLPMPISADELHKAGISGAGPYEIWLPSESADPLVMHEPHRLHFTDYLRLAFENRGFVLISESPVDADAAAWTDALDFELEPF